MSNEVEVKYGDNAAGVAGRLLNAAGTLGLHPSVVKTTSDNVFLVPEEVADEAGVSYDLTDVSDEPAEPVVDDSGEVGDDQDDTGDADGDDPVEVPEGDLESRVTWVAEGEDESERTKRANAVHLHEVEAGDLDEAGLDELSADLTVAVHGSAPDDQDDNKDDSASADEPLVGKALNAALKDAGLPTSGKVADKQARLAEHLSKKE